MEIIKTTYDSSFMIHILNISDFKETGIYSSKSYGLDRYHVPPINQDFY